MLLDHPIVFHPAISQGFGGFSEALFSQQIAGWSDKRTDPEWILKPQIDFELETFKARA